MTDAERLENTDLTGSSSPETEVLWALNYLLSLPDEDDSPYILKKETTLC